MAVSMFAIILIPFVCTLLVLLLVKVPKVGGWLIAGLILVAPLILLRMWNVPGHSGGIALWPLLAIFSVFFFVLLVLLLVKAPKVGAGVIVALVVMALLGLFLVPVVSYRRVEYREPSEVLLPAIQHAPRRTVGTSPIWSEGVEAEFEADVYPSKWAAVGALGARLKPWIRQVVADTNQSPEIVLFQEGQDRSLMWELEGALEKALSDVPCSIESGLRNIDDDEIGVTLGLEAVEFQSPQWWERSGPKPMTGRMVAQARHRGRQTTVAQSFVEKPWAEDFASFANERADKQFVVARSQSACTSENEAKGQAEGSACAQVFQRLRPLPPRIPGQAPPSVSATDLLEGGFIADSFVQSFDGSAGRIWRQTLLLDVSTPKLRRLEARMNRLARDTRMSWARMGFSVIGVLVLIGAVYFFLNMATRGYYEWSLRVAGVVLAIIAVISVLMIVQ